MYICRRLSSRLHFHKFWEAGHDIPTEVKAWIGVANIQLVITKLLGEPSRLIRFHRAGVPLPKHKVPGPDIYQPPKDARRKQSEAVWADEVCKLVPIRRYESQGNTCPSGNYSRLGVSSRCRTYNIAASLNSPITARKAQYCQRQTPPSSARGNA